MIFSNIKIIDLISLLVILLSVLASTWRGFIKESLTVIIWIIAYFLSNTLFLNVFKYLTVRTGLSMLTSMTVVFLIGGPLINYFSSHQIHDPIREDGPSEHIVKKIGTPTMGGTLILSSIILSVILWGDLENRYLWVAFLTTISFGVLGWIDDRLKIKHKSSDGLSASSKILWQSVITIVACSFLFYSHENIEEVSLIVPFFKDISIPLGVGFIFLSYFVVLGTSNAVNLTDGLDGLAILPCVMVAAGLGLIGYLAGNIIYADFLNIPYLPGTGEMIAVSYTHLTLPTKA